MSPVPIFLDTDIGGDIDDTWALAFLLNCPELKLEYALTCVPVTSYRAKVVAKLFQWANNTETPIGMGIESTSAIFPGPCPKRQASWIEEVDLKNVPNPVVEDGVKDFVEKIMAYPDTPTIVAIGPLVNIAQALEIEPAIAEKCRIVILGGSVRIGYFGQSTPSREYNIVYSPEAAQKVFTAPWKETVVVPLDTCGYIYLDGPDYQKLRESDAPMAKAVIENYQMWRHEETRNFEQRSSLLCDTVPVGLAFDESWCIFEELPLRVTDEGDTVIDEVNGKMCRVATDWKDLPGFKHFLSQRLLKK